MCEHLHCAGVLALEPPGRLVIVATLVCDDCGTVVRELAAVSAEATVFRLLSLPYWIALEEKQ